jgi:4-amino-4-deoxy-L-arabinose transferase-like glycosyltransferase
VSARPARRRTRHTEAFVFDFLLLILIVVACGLGPGFFFVRHLRWDPAETLAGSVALSLVLLYVATFIGFWLNSGAWFNVAVTAVAACLLAASARDLRGLLWRPQVRPVVVALMLLQVWLMGSLLLIRHYSGGDSCCDWVEHYQRTLHFLDPGPIDFAFIKRYALTARPPLQNLLSAHVLAHIGPQFAWHQVTFTLLASLVFLPCALFARLVARRGFNRPLLLAVVLGANPMFFVNATYPWTKALTVFFVALGIWFYLRGWARPGRRYLPAAFLSLAAGVLVHYSAVPYAMFLGGHYLVVLWQRQRRPWFALATVVGPPAAVLALWFGWAVLTYGVAGTFLSNSTARGFRLEGWMTNVATMAGNVVDTMRPSLFVRDADHTWLRALTDRTFMLYQPNLFFGMGSVMSIVAVWCIGSALLRSRWSGNPGGRTFWALFIPFAIVVGVSTHAERQETGLAFIALQPLIYLAVTLVVANLRELAGWGRGLLLAGVVADFFLGVALQLHMQQQMATWARSTNWDAKREHGLRYLGDHAWAWMPGIRMVLATLAIIGLGYLIAAFWPRADAGDDSMPG